MKKVIPVSVNGSLTCSGLDHEVKGFMSISSVDLDEDLASPEAFDLKGFMKKGTLLYNHKLWLDERGNPIPVGQVTQADVVKLVDGTDTEFGIKRISDGEIIDTFPKEVVPNLSVGDRGIFVRAKVDVEEVWRRVLRRMLTGFSWQGLARYGAVKVGKAMKKFLSSVSLSEVSLVFSPRQMDSMMVPVMKSAIVDEISNVVDMSKEPLVIFCFSFSPDVFDMASSSEWLKKRGFQFEDNFVESDDGNLLYVQASVGMVEEASVRTMKIATGVNIFAGRAKNEELSGNEKDELLRLTKEVISDTMLAKSSTGDTIMKKDAHTQGDVPVAVATSTEPVTVEQPVEQAAPVENPAPVVVPESTEIPEVAPVVAPVVEPVVAPVVPEGEVQTIAQAAPPVAEPPKVENKEARTVRRSVNEAVEAALTDSKVVERMSGLMAQQLSTIVGQKFDQVLASVSDKIQQFNDVATRLSAMLDAQAKAIMDAVAQPNEAALAKSAESRVANEALQVELTKLRADLGRVSGDLAIMQKTAVSETVREEPKRRQAADAPKSIGSQVLPSGFLGLD